MSAVVTAAALLGAAVLVAAEFTTLLRVRPATFHASVIQTVTAGAHHSYALLPVALLAIGLALVGRSAESRLAYAAVGVLGLVALGIALLGDLPDVHAVGLIRHANGTYVSATSSAGAGMYLETLGAVVLLVSGAAGVMLAPRARRHSRPERDSDDRLRRSAS